MRHNGTVLANAREVRSMPAPSFITVLIHAGFVTTTSGAFFPSLYCTNCLTANVACILLHLQHFSNHVAHMLDVLPLPLLRDVSSILGLAGLACPTQPHALPTTCTTLDLQRFSNLFRRSTLPYPAPLCRLLNLSNLQHYNTS
jgi:hypothetical protein